MSNTVNANALGKTTNKILDYLDQNKIAHDVLEHKTVYTAIDAANTMKKKMEEIVKSILVKADQKYFIVSLPSDHNLDLSKLKKVIVSETGEKVKVLQIPDEKTIKNIKKLKNGISAFGRMHDLPVIIEKKLAKLKKAVFASGSFNHSIEMAVKDFVKLENAIMGSFGIKKKVKIIKSNNMPSAKKAKINVMKKKATKKAAPKKKAVKKAAKKKAAPKKKVAKKKAAKKTSKKK